MGAGSISESENVREDFGDSYTNQIHKGTLKTQEQCVRSEAQGSA